MKPFLEVKNLAVHFPTEDGMVLANDGISFSVARGETLAIVGESGSGKSVANLAVMGLHNRHNAQITGEAILHMDSGSVDVLKASNEDVRRLRGREMAMIFQDPMSALHPYYTIGDQLMEAHRLHNNVSKDVSMKRVVEMLELVGIPEPQKRANEFPHQFSGGMRQRVMIAMALINNPSLLIADEPTTALDVTVQAQIIRLLRDLQKEFNMAVVIITHDLGVVADVANRVEVMYAGRIVESGTVDDIYYRPKAPYTIGLLSSIPSVYGKGSARLEAIPGQPPSLINLPTGCPFQPRCSVAQTVTDGRCTSELPELLEVESGHKARCHADLAARQAAYDAVKARRGGAA